MTKANYRDMVYYNWFITAIDVATSTRNNIMVPRE